MTDVFLSYSRKDRSRVEKLAAALEAAGYSVWWDMNLTGGVQFSKETGDRLKEARAIVVAWSKTSISSMWVADEATVGRTKGNLVPIAIDPVEPPLGFGQIHAIDFWDWTGDAGEPAFLALNQSLAALLGRDAHKIAASPARPMRRLVARARRHWKVGAGAALAIFAAISAGLFWRVGGADRPFAKSLAENAIAVLPFRNDSGEARDDYLSEGFADELRDQLGRVAGLKVAARPSSVAFRGEKLGVEAIAKELGVARLIEGSLLKQGGRLRISVQIMDGRTGYQTWSQSYNRTAADLLAIQQEIATAVVAEVVRDGKAPAPVTTDITAYDKLLLARHYDQEVRDAQVVDEAKLGKAIDLYRAAVEADPASALAHSRLAGALLYSGDADAAEPEIFRALSLDPDSSEVQSTLGAFYYARDLPGVGAAFERAIGLNPNNLDALSGSAHWNWYFSPQPLDNAEKLFRRAIDLDPMSLSRYGDLGYLYGASGQRDKAMALTEDIASRFPDERGLSTIAQIFELIGDFDLAVGAAKRALALSPQDEDIKAQLAELYAAIGDFGTAAKYEPEPGLGQLFWRRDYPALIDLAEDLVLDQPGESQIWYLLGFAYAVEGGYENAVRVLKIAGLPVEAHSESTVGNDQAAELVLAAALLETQAGDEGRAVAQSVATRAKRFVDTGADQGTVSGVFLSCGLALLGRDDEAMATFAHVNDGPGLPRLPWLKDYPCFKRFAADKRYTSVIAAVEKRRAELRAKVAAMDDLSSN